MNIVQKKNVCCSLKNKRNFGWCFYATLFVIAGIAVWWKLVTVPESKNVGLTGESVAVNVQKPSAAEVERKRREYAQAKAEAEKLQLEEQKYKSDIRRRAALFQSNIEAAYERFVRQIPFTDAQASMEAARNGAKFLASSDGLCGFKTLTSMTYKVAYDKINETNTLNDFVNPLLEQHVMKNVRDAVEVYKTKQAAFRNEMECEMSAYQADVMLMGKQLECFTSQLAALNPAVVKATQDKISAVNSKTKEMAESTVWGAVSVVAEAVFIRSTIAAVETLGTRLIVPLLANSAARCGASYAAGAGAAVADGPIPIGDVIGALVAIGGTAWTAYDIYKIKEVMPKEIEQKLCECVNEIDAGLRDNAIGKAKEIVTEMKKMSEEQVKGL